MEIIRGSEFSANTAWGSRLIANMNGITSKIHWTDQVYQWHVNDGEEVFAVLDGKVIMHYRQQGVDMSQILNVGDIFYAKTGCEHFADPQGEARILVIEKQGSV